MRLFVAIDLESEIRERVSDFASGLKRTAPDVRWTLPQSWHITLKFIGEVPPDRLPKIKEQLEKINAGPADIRVGGTGFFPNQRSARVFWAGVHGDSALAALAEAVDRSLGSIGIPFEERAFTPHLTLARSASTTRGSQSSASAKQQFAKLQQQLEKVPSPDFGTMTAREFFLYQSQTSSKGAEYTKLARYELK